MAHSPEINAALSAVEEALKAVSRMEDTGVRTEARDLLDQVWDMINEAAG